MMDACVCSQVYMAKDKATGEVVAIKKIRSLNEVQGVSFAASFSLQRFRL